MTPSNYAELLSLRKIVNNADSVEGNIYSIVSGYDRSSAWRDSTTRKMFNVALSCLAQWDTKHLGDWCTAFMESHKTLWFTPAPEADHA